MDPQYTGEILKHLEKQSELLMDAYNSMSNELHKLQVEEEMLMRKFYEIMTAHGMTKRNEGSSNVEDCGQALLTYTGNVSEEGKTGNHTDDGKTGHSTESVPAANGDEQE